jgi:hypothetical protein
MEAYRPPSSRNNISSNPSTPTAVRTFGLSAPVSAPVASSQRENENWSAFGSRSNDRNNDKIGNGNSNKKNSEDWSAFGNKKKDDSAPPAATASSLTSKLYFPKNSLTLQIENLFGSIEEEAAPKWGQSALKKAAAAAIAAKEAATPKPVVDEFPSLGSAIPSTPKPNAWTNMSMTERMRIRNQQEEAERLRKAEEEELVKLRDDNEGINLRKPLSNFMHIESDDDDDNDEYNFGINYATRYYSESQNYSDAEFDHTAYDASDYVEDDYQDGRREPVTDADGFQLVTGRRR